MADSEQQIVDGDTSGGVGLRLFWFHEKSPWSIFQGLFVSNQYGVQGSVGGSPPKKGILCFDTSAAACAPARSGCRFVRFVNIESPARRKCSPNEN